MKLIAFTQFCQLKCFLGLKTGGLIKERALLNEVITQLRRCLDHQSCTSAVTGRPLCVCICTCIFNFLGHRNVFLAAVQEKTSSKPGGMFQPNLGRHVTVTVFIFEFVNEEFFLNPLLLLKLVSILDISPFFSFVYIILIGIL